MPNEEDFQNDPPIKVGTSIESRCLTHPESHGENYREHLALQHKPEVEA